MNNAPDGAEDGDRALWLNRLVAVFGAVVLIGGSVALLRWSDSLALTYVFIAVGVMAFAGAGILVKRRTEDRARTPGLD